MGIRWDGIDKVLGNLDRIATSAPDGARGALGLAAEHVATVSARLVPLESGALVGSRKVTVDGARAAISYGTPYARYQHFRLDLRHEHGQALYLEQPIRTERGTVIKMLADGAFHSMAAAA